MPLEATAIMIGVNDLAGSGASRSRRAAPRRVRGKPNVLQVAFRLDRSPSRCSELIEQLSQQGLAGGDDPRNDGVRSEA